MKRIILALLPTSLWHVALAGEPTVKIDSIKAEVSFAGQRVTRKMPLNEFFGGQFSKGNSFSFSWEIAGPDQIRFYVWACDPILPGDTRRIHLHGRTFLIYDVDRLEEKVIDAEYLDGVFEGRMHPLKGRNRVRFFINNFPGLGGLGHTHRFTLNLVEVN